MRIGIDLDNTIVNYDHVFKSIAYKNKLINKNWSGTKSQLKKKITKNYSVEKWKKLQGLAYGRYMNAAVINQGFKNFYQFSKIFNCNVFIVSHKTKYGHYDKSKISLRNEASKWIKKNVGIKENNIFFEESIEDKIKRINKLNLDYFIDDLLIILNNKHLSKKIKKIHYSDLLTWSKIKDNIFDINKEKNLQKVFEFILKKRIKKIIRLKKLRNSKIYKCYCVDKSKYLIKNYPDYDLDLRARLKRELVSLNLLKRLHFTNITKIKNTNLLVNCASFKWIDGRKISKINNKDLLETSNFIGKLYSIKRKTTDNYPYNAVESCKNVNDIIDQINDKYKSLILNKSLPVVLRNFLIKKIRYKINNFKVKKKYLNNIKKRYEILSPSDFGFHNSLRRDKKIIFFDFEYFGKDDPVKLVADFLLHPGMKIKDCQKKFWFNKVKKIFRKDKDFQNRLIYYLPFYVHFQVIMTFHILTYLSLNI